MNRYTENYKRLLFRNELLQARLNIRDFFIANIVREIYENTGQLLSLARIQLAVSDLTKNKNDIDNSPATTDLLGESIRNLRMMCAGFYCDTDILKECGLIDGVSRTMEIVYRNAEKPIDIKGRLKEDDIQNEMKIILFRMLQEILISIKEPENLEFTFDLLPAENKIEFLIRFTGKFVLPDETVENNDRENGLSLLQRARLINAKIRVSVKKKTVCIRLISPLNYIV